MTKDGHLSYRKEIRTILKHEGKKGLARGLTGSLCRFAPSWAINIASFELLKDLVKSDDRSVSMTWQVMSGGLAGIFGGTIAIPADVIKSKQMMHRGKPLSVLAAYRQLSVDGHSWVFKGARAALLRACINSMVFLPLYDTTFRWLQD